jgi:hypothetical protein
MFMCGIIINDFAWYYNQREAIITNSYHSRLQGMQEGVWYKVMLIINSNHLPKTEVCATASSPNLWESDCPQNFLVFPHRLHGYVINHLKKEREENKQNLKVAII